MCIVAVVDACDHVTLGGNVTDLERETTLVFEVNTCSRVHVQLATFFDPNMYQLEFASSILESNDVSIVSTSDTNRQMSHISQDCATTRQFWVSWKDDVISGGIGLSPGTKELMRLVDGRKADKSVSLAKMTTTPVDESATFKTFRSEYTQ